MSFIYLPSVVVQPYSIFGVPLFAVESICADYDTGNVYKLNQGWFNNYWLASKCANSIKEGNDECSQEENY